MFNELSAWLKSTALHEFITSSYLIFPAAETLHFMGLTMLVGALLIVDLRGMGFIKSISMETAHKFVPVALIAFSVNLVTGIIFIFADPDRYFINIAFQVKMLLILVAGINALVFEFAVFRPAMAGRSSAAQNLLAKLTSGTSLLIWTCVIIGGRLIPYVEY